MAMAGRTLAGYRLLKLRYRRPEQLAAYRAATHASHAHSAERIYDAALRMQGLMIKVGQTIGSNPTAMPAEYITVLSRLQDAVPARPWNVARPAIEQELGRPIEEVFASIEHDAVAAASLAQVHRAVLHDGRRVAVKLLYPGIERLVHSDLRVLKVLLWLESRFAGYPLKPVYDELATNIPLEVDLIHEAAALEEMAALYGESDAIYLPKVVREYLSRRLLVMEWIDGIKITDVAALQRAGIDPRDVCGRLMDAYCQQIFDFGFFHADPHPGNLFVLPDGRIAIVDFGLTRRLSPGAKRGLALLTHAMLTADDAATIEAFDLLGFRLRDATNRQALLATAEFFRTVTDPAGYGSLDTLQAVNENMIRATRANPWVEMPGEITLVSRVFALLTGTGVGIGATPDVLPSVMKWTRHAVESWRKVRDGASTPLGTAAPVLQRCRL